jgi:hypothetical protein
MSDHHSQSTTAYDDPDLEWDHEDAPVEDPRPPRPRRRLLTPVSGGLLAIALVAGGFIGGVEVQKGQDDGAGGGATGFARAGGLGGAAGRQGGSGATTATGAGAGRATAAGGANATAGTVANVKGTTLYVTSADGTTVKIRTNDNAKVTRNAEASVASVHPGDTVVVQGAKNDNGTITAASITATAKGVSAFGGFGGAAPGGGMTTGGTTGVPQGFAPPQG